VGDEFIDKTSQNIIPEHGRKRNIAASYAYKHIVKLKAREHETETVDKHNGDKIHVMERKNKTEFVTVRIDIKNKERKYNDKKYIFGRRKQTGVGKYFFLH